jgi:hypothetical protein
VRAQHVAQRRVHLLEPELLIFDLGGMRGTSPSVDVKSWIVNWCVCWSSGVALVSPLGCRRNGFPIADGGLVVRWCHFV